MTDIATCGTCNRSWDDSISTSMTPAPSARCPFEYFHDGSDVPDDWPVAIVGGSLMAVLNPGDPGERIVPMRADEEQWTIDAEVRLIVIDGAVTRIIIEPVNGQDYVQESDEWSPDRSQDQIDTLLNTYLDDIGHVFGGLGTYAVEWEG